MRAMGKRSVASFVSVILTVVSWGIAAGIALSALLLLTSPIIPLRDAGADASSGWVLGLPASFSVEASRVTAPTLGIAGAEIREAQGVLRLPLSTRGNFAGVLVFVIAMLAIAWYGVSQLRKVLFSLRDERPFSADNAVRIRRIAYVVIGGELLRSGFMFAGNFYVAQYFVADGVRFGSSLGLSFPTLVCGLIIFVLAEVFRAGTRLENDQSLTI